MKAILFVILSIAVCSCKGQKFFNISKQVEKECNVNPQKDSKSFNDLRVELYKKNKLGFVDSNCDTFYILEKYDLETGSYLSSIWNRDTALSYVYSNGKFEFDKEMLFTNYTIKLIQKWDTVSIRKEEEMNANIIPQRYITGIMVIQDKKQKAKVYCITFREFFNLERDR